MAVGIIYIVVYINKYLNDKVEGFQVGTTCLQQIIGGRPTYLCPDVNSANTLVISGTTTPVCYTDTSINYASTIGTIGYTCFDINGEPQFDSTRGVYLPFDPIIDNDTMPDNGINDFNVGANSFMNGYNSFESAYNNTLSQLSTVSTLGLVNITSVQTRLQTLSTNHCVSGNVNTNACNSITSAIQTTSNIINDRSISSLYFINSTLQQSASTIKYNFYDKFMQSFYTNPSVFISSPAIAEYIGNK